MSTVPDPIVDNNCVHDPYVRDYLRTKHRAHLEDSTFVDYDIQAGHFERYFAAHVEPRRPRLSDLTVSRVKEARDWQLDRGRAKPTADKVRRALLAIWNAAAGDTDLKVFPPPPRAVRALKLPKREPQAWCLDQYEDILRFAGTLEGEVGPHRLGDWFSAVLLADYNSGLRITSLMLCEVTWIDLNQRVLVVDPDVQKDDEGISITLMPETAEALRPLVESARRTGQRRIFGDWPFDQRLLAKGRAPRALTGVLRKCIVGAGLATSVAQVSRRDLWHKIRRTFATSVYAKSGDIELVREMLGHSDIKVTWRYIDKTKLNRKTQADLLPRPRIQQLRLFGASDAG